MFAIVEIKGEQFKIDASTKKLRIPFIGEVAEGQNVPVDSVLLTSDSKGAVKIAGDAAISLSVIGKFRGEKVIVFKKKRRKGYRVKNGHRQSYTEVNVDSFSI